MNLLSLVKKAFLANWPEAIVLETQQLLFYPVPKVASSSMKSYIISLEVGPKAFAEMSHHEIHAYPFKTVHDIQWNRSLNGFRKIAIIRDPYKRLDSCYRDKILKSVRTNGRVFNGFERYNKLLRRELFRPDMSFEDFCQVVARLPDCLSDGHFRSQVTFLPKKLDYLIDVKDLDGSMPEITQALGMPAWSPDASKSNATTDLEQADEVWSVALKSLVQKRFRKDLLLHSKLEGRPYKGAVTL